MHAKNIVLQQINKQPMSTKIQTKKPK